MTKKGLIKSILLFIFDAVFIAATLFGGYMLFTSINIKIPEQLIRIIPLLVLIKVIVYAIFGLYFNKDRSMIFEIVAVMVANGASFVATKFLFKMELNIFFVFCVFTVDLIFELISRSLTGITPAAEGIKEIEGHEELIKDNFKENIRKKRNENSDKELTSEEPHSYNDTFQIEESKNLSDPFNDPFNDTFEIIEEDTEEPKGAIEESFEFEEQELDPLININENVFKDKSEIEEFEIQEKEESKFKTRLNLQQELEQMKIDELEKKLKEKEEQLSLLEAQLELSKRVNIDEYGEGIIRRKNDLDDLSKRLNQKQIIDDIFDDIKNLYSSLDAKAKSIQEQENILITRLDALEHKQETIEYEAPVKKRRRTRLSDAELLELTDKKLRKREKNETKTKKNYNYISNVTDKNTESIIEDIEKIKMEISDMHNNNDASYNYISEILNATQSPFETALLEKNEKKKQKKNKIKNIKAEKIPKQQKAEVISRETTPKNEQRIETIQAPKQMVIDDAVKEVNNVDIKQQIKENVDKADSTPIAKNSQAGQSKQKETKASSTGLDFLPEDIINDFKNVSTSVASKPEVQSVEVSTPKISKSEISNIELTSEKTIKTEEQKSGEKKKAPRRKPKQPKKNTANVKTSNAADTDELLKPMLAELKLEISPKINVKKETKKNIINFKYLSMSKLDVKENDFKGLSNLIDQI